MGKSPLNRVLVCEDKGEDAQRPTWVRRDGGEGLGVGRRALLLLSHREPLHGVAEDKSGDLAVPSHESAGLLQVREPVQKENSHLDQLALGAREGALQVRLRSQRGTQEHLEGPAVSLEWPAVEPGGALRHSAGALRGDCELDLGLKESYWGLTARAPRCRGS